MAADERRAESAFAAIAEDLLHEAGVQKGTGFGSKPGLRVGSKIFAMLIDEELVVKLPAERTSALRDTGGARSFKAGERQMREWVAVAHGGPDDWSALAREALSFVRR